MAGHLLDESARGVFIIAATPFADNGTLDLKSLERLIGFYIDAGVHGITLLGMMGEAQKLTYDEARLVIQASLRQVAGEVPVVVGVSSPGLATLAALTSDAMSLGAAAVMVAPPSGLVTDEQVEGYVHQLCRAIGEDVPLVLQDYPQATGVHLSVAVLNRLIDDLPQIKVLKHEDCPGLGKLTRLRAGAARDGRRRIAVLVGNGGLYYPLELGRGADGAMTGFAYPEVLVEVYERFAAGREEAAFDLYDAYLPLIRYEQQPGAGLAVRKYVLQKRGIISSSAQRKPGATITATAKAEVEYLLSRVARVDRRANLQPQSSAAG